MTGRRRANRDGTVYLRPDGRWSGQVYVNQSDGTRARRTVYGRTRREAEQKMLELRRKSEARTPIAPADLTLGKYLNEWLDLVVSARVRPNTLAGYRYHAQRYLLPDLGTRSLAKLTARDVRLYVESLRARGVGARTVQYGHSTLRAALEDAVREEILEKNVAKLVRVPRPPKQERRPLTLDEIRTLLTATRNDRLYALFVVLAVLGLRRSEALGLKWQDVDLEEGTLKVRHGLQRIDGELRLLPPKTSRSRRTVPLPGIVVEALQQHHERQDRQRDALSSRWPDLGFVFTTEVGTPIDPRNCTRILQKAMVAADLRVVRLHDFRHGCVSVLLSMGVPPRTVMDIVGHSTVEVTMNVYGHVSLEEKREALARIDDLLTSRDG